MMLRSFICTYPRPQFFIRLKQTGIPNILPFLYPTVFTTTVRVLVPFTTSYMCVVGFSAMTGIKNKFRNKLQLFIKHLASKNITCTCGRRRHHQQKQKTSSFFTYILLCIRLRNFSFSVFNKKFKSNKAIFFIQPPLPFKICITSERVAKNQRFRKQVSTHKSLGSPALTCNVF